MRDHPQPRPLHRVRAGLAVIALAAALVVLAGVALSDAAAPPKATTLGLATGVTVAGRTQSIVTSSRGLTVYTLSGDSARHAKCTKANACFTVWPPVRVSSRRAKLSAARGIRGRLGVLHRDGIFQLTLGGRPLYTYIGDGGHKRSAAGEGIVSFGGTWRVIAVRTTSSHTTTSTTSTTSTPNPYGY